MFSTGIINRMNEQAVNPTDLRAKRKSTFAQQVGIAIAAVNDILKTEWVDDAATVKVPSKTMGSCQAVVDAVGRRFEACGWSITFTNSNYEFRVLPKRSAGGTGAT